MINQRDCLISREISASGLDNLPLTGYLLIGTLDHPDLRFFANEPEEEEEI